MNNNLRFIKDLAPGDLFRIDHPTVYRCVSIRTGGSKTAVSYVVEGHTSVNEYVRPSLATVTLIGN